MLILENTGDRVFSARKTKMPTELNIKRKVEGVSRIAANIV